MKITGSFSQHTWLFGMLIILSLLCGSASAQFSSPAGLKYFTETDDNDTSVFTAASPNTWIGFNNNLTVTSDIWANGSLTCGGNIVGGGNLGINYSGISTAGYLYAYEGGSASGAYLKYDSVANQWSFSHTVVLPGLDLYTGSDAGGAYDSTDVPADGDVWTWNSGGTIDWQPDAGAGGGEANTLLDTGTYNETSGFGLAGGKTGVALKVKGLLEGSGIEIAKSGDSALTITSTAADSVGKAYGDASGNQITATYLPLSGGTLTGNLGIPGYFINEILAIDVDSGFYMENVEDAGFRSYVQFDLDKMYIGATNVSNVRERVWQFFLSDLTGLTPASLGTPAITGNVDWKANPVPYTYIAANAIDSTKVVAASLSMSADVHAFSSADLLGRLSDETGSGLAVFGTSPTFTTDITSPLIIGGTGTTSDLSLKTTSGVGTTGADMHFLVGNDGATEAMTILNNGYVGIGTDAPTAPLEVEGIFQGTVGGFPSGLFHVTRGGDAEFANAVITGHNTYNTNTQLWYLGSTSSGNYDIGLINRQNGKMYFATNNANRMVIDATGYVGIGGTLSPPERLSVVGNIATGDTAAGDIDVFHYFSTDGSWTTEYMMWNDGDAGFQLSDDLDVTGTIKSDDTLFYTFTLADPDALYAKDTQWGFDPKTRLAITIRSIYVSLDADPTTEMTYSIVFCDAGVGWVSPTTVDDTATVAGVTDVTGGFGDATVPAGKKLYFLFDADPDDAITQADIKIGYTID